MRPGLFLAIVLSVVGCHAADDGPIVYTAPPEVLDRSFPPPPTASPGPSAGVASPSPAVSPSSSSPPRAASAPPPGDPSAPATSPTSAASPVIAVPIRGGILFGMAAGPDSCSIANPTAELRSTDPIFISALLKDHMTGAVGIRLLVTRDGTTVIDQQIPAGGTAFDCYFTGIPTAQFPPGTYRFQVLQGTTLEADGTLTIS